MIEEVHFNYTLAKQITNKEVDGFIQTTNELNARIICFDFHNPAYPIIGLTCRNGGEEEIRRYDIDGKCEHDWTQFDLHLFIRK